jgi:hypothetical protein
MKATVLFAPTLLTLLTAAVAAQQPAAPPVKGAMPALGRPTESTDTVPPFDFGGYFSGKWDFEWDVPMSPLGGDGSITGTTAYTRTGDGTFVAESAAEGPDGKYTVTERITFDKAAQTIVRQVSDSRGFAYASKATVKGDLGGIYYILLESEPFTVKGRSIRLRESLRTLSPFNYRVAVTMSVDGGPFTNFGNPWWNKQEQ